MRRPAAAAFASAPGVPYASRGAPLRLWRLASALLQTCFEREAELEALTDAIRRATDGAGTSVFIQGPAGVGKSRLRARARRDAGAAGLRVLEARGAPLEREFAFGVARQLLEATVVTAAASERERLFRGAAALSERLFGEAGPELVAQAGDAAFGALHGLYWLTVNLADQAPLMLSVDDAQWADTPSLRFLGYLSRRLDELPMVRSWWPGPGARGPEPSLGGAR